MENPKPFQKSRNSWPCQPSNLLNAKGVSKPSSNFNCDVLYRLAPFTIQEWSRRNGKTCVSTLIWSQAQVVGYIWSTHDQGDSHKYNCRVMMESPSLIEFPTVASYDIFFSFLGLDIPWLRKNKSRFLTLAWHGSLEANKQRTEHREELGLGKFYCLSNHGIP
jgi:hypothetical protein